MATRAKVKNDCPLGQYKAGEIGTLLPNNSDKYDYLMELPKAQVTEEMQDCSFNPSNGWVARVYYFYADDIEIVPQENEDEDFGFSPR